MTCPPSAPPFSPVHHLRLLWATHPPLLLSALVAAGTGLFFLAGIFLDPRYVTGAPVWLKPLKFAVSVSSYRVTLVWMLGFVRGRARLVVGLGWAVLVTLALEWFAIITQAARGTTSHFNVTTPLDSALWSLMGASIAVLWLAAGPPGNRHLGAAPALRFARAGLVAAAGPLPRAGGHGPGRPDDSAARRAVGELSRHRGGTHRRPSRRRAAACGPGTSLACTPSRCCPSWARCCACPH